MAEHGFEPDLEVSVDATNLRGLAHPLRVRALGWLRRHGPATATQLANELGQSSGATSYHLRQLAAYGFVVELPGHGNGRERWWQAAHRSTRFNISAAELVADDATLGLGAEYLRAVGRLYADRIAHFTDSLEAFTAEEGDWADSFTLSDWPFALTAHQAKELIHELDRLGDRFRAEQAVEGSPGVRTVRLQVQVFPSEPA